MAVMTLLAILLAGLSLTASAAVYVAARARGETGTEPLSALATAAAFAHEWLALIALLLALPLRLGRAADARTAPKVALFIPELRCSSAGFWYLRGRLRASGWVGIAGLDRTRSADLRDAAAALDARIATLAPDSELVVVGHGVGGLLARDYAAARRLRHVITLGTPHAGSAALPYRVLGGAPAPTDAGPQANPLVDVIALYSDFDAWLQPMDNAYCPGGFNIAVSGLGHCAMLLSPRVADLIAENLPAPGSALRR